MAPKKYNERILPSEESMDALVIDVEAKQMMNAAIQRLELLRVVQ